MKATGIVRRIDDLGRVVIPKEIRRNMNIREGDPLEIYITKDGCVCLKKYQPVGEYGWQQAKSVVREMLTCGFALVDADEVAQEYTDPRILAVENPFKAEICVDGYVVGYVVAEEPDKNLELAASVCGALFE